MGKIMAGTPMIKVYPEEANPEGEPEFAAVLKALQSLETDKKINEILRSHGAIALVITPEPSSWIERDTGCALDFHVLMAENSPDIFILGRLASELDDVFELKGLIVPFTRDSISKFAHEFRIRDIRDNPLHQIFTEIDKRSKEV